MRTLIVTDGHVFHMEFDMLDPERILFTEYHELKTTDGVTAVTLVGSIDSGYVEGRGTAAMFWMIKGFTQINYTSILAADFYNSCLRLIDRLTLDTSRFVGKCQFDGFRDGTAAWFHQPHSVIKDPRAPDQVLVTDKANSAVRQVDLITRATTTLIKESAGLNHPTGMTFDKRSRNLIVSSYDSVNMYNLATGNLSKIGDSVGFRDGRLSDAEFDSPNGLSSLSKYVTLAADTLHNRLRVVNSVTDRVKSICTGTQERVDGSAGSCAMVEPYSLLAKDGQIYVGELQSIRILSCKYGDH